ncbi:MAG: thiamine phosphate synthase [Pedobacter sp.]|uniref:thiamine phosphate synthase n=1 Tax=Pedobacter sp. TaxID=1411316 RepID=UPI002806E93D|nr:thiamine phosphate synthase [Pedobacter sp.]MDQ8005033.1 thiamine phosphate synthase [Pedobacter sp.]
MMKTVQNGIYLIIDPSVKRETLLSKLNEILSEEIAIIQIWDNFKPNEDPLEITDEILRLCHKKNIPVLINNQWQLLKKIDLDGVHFDEIQNNIYEIKHDLGRKIITGVTCNNDLSVVKWANDNELNYISFCSMFSSSTANSCDLVTFKTVKDARKITSLPIFLAGGIKPENIEMLNELPYSGIAIVSGIMEADKPSEAIRIYKQKIKAQ